MAKTVHYGSHDGSTIHATSFWSAVRSYKPGTALKFTVDEYVPTKTQQQNSYLHVLFDIAARAMNKDAMGDGSQWTPETVKQHCKDEKLYPIVDRIMPGGVIVQVTLDTRHLNLRQASETIDRVIAYFAEWHIILPHPREQQSMKL